MKPVGGGTRLTQELDEQEWVWRGSRLDRQDEQEL